MLGCHQHPSTTGESGYSQLSVVAPCLVNGFTPRVGRHLYPVPVRLIHLMHT
jgi:hypothetical protein